YAFRTHGSLYHSIGSLLPEEDAQPNFSQIDVFDTVNEMNTRHIVFNSVKLKTLERLQGLMHEINPYVLYFKTMAQLVSESPASVPDISMIFCSEGVSDPRQYNRPTTSTEVGVLIIGSNENQEAPRSRDIVIRPRNSGLLQKINEINQSYDPMNYVLLFPDGQLG
ncbi:hypothetical protein BDF14DRAFT_1733906, partial [Spinellus fusiger]